MGLTDHMRDLLGYRRPQRETNKRIEIYSETLGRGLWYIQITQEDGEKDAL